jgi:hypothetical protein
MKTSNIKKIKTFARLTQSKLVSALTELNNSFEGDRQNILTELMLIDIETNDCTVDSDEKKNANCFFRTTNTGTYFLAKGRGKGKPQLAQVAKDRLNKVAKDAYSANDFRRCYDFIKAQSGWNGDVFEVEYDKVNSVMRDGGRWPNLNQKKSKPEVADTIPTGPQKPTTEKAIIAMAGIDAPEIRLIKKTNTPKFKSAPKATTYYTRIIQKLMSDVRKGGMTIEVTLDGNKIVLTGDDL